MQCRAIARRSEHGSITLLGDLAQGTAPWAARDWADTLTHLGKPGARVVPLTTGFRVPEVDRRPGQPAAAGARRRRTRRRSRCAATAGLRHPVAADDLAPRPWPRSAAALDHEGSVGGHRRRRRRRPRCAAALPRPASRSPHGRGGRRRVTVLPASLAKGLEYDHVIVVEPADIVAAEPRGLHRLYVVLTRAVSRLAVLHAQPLPAPPRLPPPA